MRIHLARLQEGPFEYDVNFSPAYLMEGVEGDLRFEAGAGTVTFRLIGQEVVATGELRTAVHGACARCLTPASAPLAARSRARGVQNRGHHRSRRAGLRALRRRLAGPG